MLKILLCDDDETFVKLMQEYLSTHSMNVHYAFDGITGLQKLKTENFDLAILDVMMPGLEGIELLKFLREFSALPVIMLTAKAEELDKILGLELGADDYLAKPCHPRELVARIHAVLRRSSPQTSQTPEVIELKKLRLNKKNRKCWLAESLLPLTDTEFSLLWQLILHKHKTLSKELLSKKVLNRSLQTYDRSLDVHISNLRKKLSPVYTDSIKTIRNRGYQLVL